MPRTTKEPEIAETFDQQYELVLAEVMLAMERESSASELKWNFGRASFPIALQAALKSGPISSRPNLFRTFLPSSLAELR